MIQSGPSVTGFGFGDLGALRNGSAQPRRTDRISVLINGLNKDNRNKTAPKELQVEAARALEGVDVRCPKRDSD